MASVPPPEKTKGAAKSKPKNKLPWESRYDSSRTTGPDTRDPRCAGAPCMGQHQVALPGRGSPTGSNAHGSWEGCQRCLLRLSYTPAYGSHALCRKAAPLPADTAAMIQAVGPNNAGYNDKLKDKNIALDAAEKSALDKVEKIRAQKAALAKQTTRKPDYKEETNSMGTATSSATPTVVVVDEMNVTPGRKSRKPEVPAEDLEYCDRTEKSWSRVEDGSQSSPTPSP